MKSRFIVALAVASAQALVDEYGRHPGALGTSHHVMGDVRYRNLERE